jgi:sulfite reductase (NADPH) hemoprotein beta-component
MFMVRGRIPGGVVTADQYLTFDRISEDYGNRSLRITTRQGFQFHGVVKQGLRPLVNSINRAFSTTLAACGDVMRNVIAPPTPATSPLVRRIFEDARMLSRELLPKTPAYHEIWIDGAELPANAAGAAAVAAPAPVDFVDPLYGKTYLPRKFKIAFAIPPLNDVDIFTNCLGFVAIIGHGELLGYNVLAGGGMGMSHGNKETFPRVADVIGFITPEKVTDIAKAVLTAFRDYGDRANRKHARLKYVLEDRGPAWFRAEIETRSGHRLEGARPFQFTRQTDLFGWHGQDDGNYFLGLYVENGRVKDAPGYLLKTALRRVVETYRPEVRLTTGQNLLLTGVTPAQRAGLTALLAEHGIPVENQRSAVRRASMACPALPTCGLALAESERAMPGLLDKLETLLAELGLADEEFIIRMTGCPNGCARPYTAEIGIVGRAPNKYNLYLGGNEGCTRLNRPFRDGVKGEELVSELRPALARFAAERLPGERFGDFADRILLPDLVAAAGAPKPAAELAGRA